MAEIQNISIELVKVHPNNVRKTYNDIEELAESIKAKGILQNLTVVPDPQEPGKYLTVIGNRRLTAARMAGLETVSFLRRQSYQTTSFLLVASASPSTFLLFQIFFAFPVYFRIELFPFMLVGTVLCRTASSDL